MVRPAASAEVDSLGGWLDREVGENGLLEHLGANWIKGWMGPSEYAKTMQWEANLFSSGGALAGAERTAQEPGKWASFQPGKVRGVDDNEIKWHGDAQGLDV